MKSSKAISAFAILAISTASAFDFEDHFGYKIKNEESSTQRARSQKSYDSDADFSDDYGSGSGRAITQYNGLNFQSFLNPANQTSGLHRTNSFMNPQLLSTLMANSESFMPNDQEMERIEAQVSDMLFGPEDGDKMFKESEKGGKVDKVTLTEPTFERDLDFLDNDRALEYDQKEYDLYGLQEDEEEDENEEEEKENELEKLSGIANVTLLPDKERTQLLNTFTAPENPSSRRGNGGGPLIGGRAGNANNNRGKLIRRRRKKKPFIPLSQNAKAKIHNGKPRNPMKDPFVPKINEIRGGLTLPTKAAPKGLRIPGLEASPTAQVPIARLPGLPNQDDIAAFRQTFERHLGGAVGSAGRHIDNAGRHLQGALKGAGYRRKRPLHQLHPSFDTSSNFVPTSFKDQQTLKVQKQKKQPSRPLLKKQKKTFPPIQPEFTNTRPTLHPIADCDFYTDTLCLNVNNYPSDEILSQLSDNRRAGSNLIADVVDQSADHLIDGVTSSQENSYTFSHYFGEPEGSNRRQDDVRKHRDFAEEGGFLCPSEIMYAKPKRGRTAQGVWKDIVNVKDYTQTLRMEKCLKPGGQCSYVSHHYKSQCSQIYNYHRLLSWDETRGLHMDIYKVPTCCSCHIKGYSYVYPPLKTGPGPQTPAFNDFSSNPDFGENEVVDYDEFRADEFNAPNQFNTPNEFSTNSQFNTPNEFNANGNQFDDDFNQDFSKSQNDFSPRPSASRTGPEFPDFINNLGDEFSEKGPGFGVRRDIPKNALELLDEDGENLVDFNGKALDKNELRFLKKGRKNKTPRGRIFHGESRERPVTRQRPPVSNRNAFKRSEKDPLFRRRGSSQPLTTNSKENRESSARVLEAVQESSSPGEDEITGDPVKIVNYGYHPIIDFFDRYRWSAARKK